MDFSSTILLNPGIERFQAVYAGQIYGTFFGLFARCDFETGEHQSGKCTLIKKINLILINYKGEKNVELSLDFPKPEFKPIEPAGPGSEKKKIIKLDINARISKEAKAIQENIIIDLTKWHKDGLLVEQGDTIQFYRNTERLNTNSLDKLEDRAFVNGMFDSEHFIRDGIFVIPKPQIDYEIKENKIRDWDISYGSPSCTPGNNFVQIV